MGVTHKPTSMDPGRVGCCPILQRKGREELSDPGTASGFLAINVEKSILEEEEKLQLLSGFMALDSGVAEFRPGGTQVWLSKRESF